MRGFATEVGGPGSHTAIVAEGLEIPAVVGVGTFLTDISGGDLVIIDGDNGLVILQPDEETVHYRYEAEQNLTRAAQLQTLRELPAETKDQQRIELFGNIEFPHEVDHFAADRGADGIGLYRTEFLYLDCEPDETVHFAAYSEVLRSMPNRPVVIRSCDLGAGQDGARLEIRQRTPRSACGAFGCR